MEKNKNTTNQFDDDVNRHREMTEERINRRKKLKRVAIGLGVTVGTMTASAILWTRVIEPWLNNSYFDQMIMGGAMGQWEEVPMREEVSMREEVPTEAPMPEEKTTFLPKECVKE